jgi:hypothetical protein
MDGEGLLNMGLTDCAECRKYGKCMIESQRDRAKECPWWEEDKKYHWKHQKKDGHK